MEQQNYEVFHSKVKRIDVKDGEEMIVLLNEAEAREYGITCMDKVSLVYEGTEFVANVDLTNKLVKHGEVGLFRDFYEKHNIPEGGLVSLHYTKSKALTINAIKKKLLGKVLTEEEIRSIVEDMNANKLSDTLVTYFAATGFFHKSVEKELAYMAKATAETGTRFNFGPNATAKYCIGGVPGNETTMIVAPIVASLGVIFPKTFSKSITSPAATGECVEVLMDIDFSADEIKKIMKKENCCLAYGANLNLAPANDKIIEVSYPISMESYSKMVVSIVAKNYAMGIKNCLIDIPVGPTAKIATMKIAKKIAKHFLSIGKYLGMNMKVVFTKAKQPVGSGIGALLQVREVLRVLEQHKDRPRDLEKKAFYLASEVLILSGVANKKNALSLVKNQVLSGEALKKMRSIIKTQGGKNPNITSDQLELAKFNIPFISNTNGEIKEIDMKYLGQIARTLGCPLEAKAGLYLHKKLGDKVEKGDVIFTLYSNFQDKLKMSIDMLNKQNIYTIK